MIKSKPTMATIKSFIRKNDGKLFINVKSKFDGMIDGVSLDRNSQFSVALKPEPDRNHENCKGVQGAWFVGSSRDHLTPFDNGVFMGYEVYNCCGSFILAVKK